MPATAEPPLARLGRFAVRRRRLVLLGWVAVLVLAVVGGPKIAGDWNVDYSTPGSDSKAVATTLEQRFPELGSESLLLTWTSGAGAKSPVATAQVSRTLRQLEGIPGFGRTSMAAAQVSPDGRTGLIEVPLRSRSNVIVTENGPRLMDIAHGAPAAGVDIRFGGQIMSEAERGSVSSEGVGLFFALLILLATFGTVIAAGLPIAIALFGIGTGSALVGGVAALVNTPDWASSVAAMVGIGVGIDYALLVLTRHRAALAAGAGVEDAVAAALSTAGRSVLIAGGTVVISMLGLLLMGLPYLTGVAFAASASVLVVMVAALTLLPALLGFAGRRIDALAVGLPGRKARKARRASSAAADRGTLPADASPAFARWSRGVLRRPWTATLVGVAICAALAAPITGVRLGFPGQGNEPAGSQARSSFAMLSAGFGPGVGGPLRVAVPVSSATDRARVAELRSAIEADPLVAAVRPAAFSADGTTALLSVQSRTSVDSTETDRLLGHLRDDLIPASGLDAKVGGLSAQTHDQSSATAARLPLLFIGVAGLSALLLLAAFRSILIPIKAAAMNLLSIGAAFGVVAMAAEGGAFGQLFGIDSEVPIPPFIPILMFAILFGLSMDYEVFLLGRIRELWLATGDAERAVADGLAATARVITAAAAIMVAVFGAFTLSDQVFLKLIGVGMATAILVDATVIRLLLVPALMGLLGRRAWWLPGWIDRLVPEAQLEAADHGFGAGTPAPAAPAVGSAAAGGERAYAGRAAPDAAS